MKLTSLLLLLSVSILAESRLPAGEPQRIGLWDGQATLGEGKVEETEDWITVYQPDKPRQSTASRRPS